MCLLISLSSCAKRKQAPPYNLDSKSASQISIPYEDLGGVKVIPVKVNGLTMNMIYDTGCSGVHLSLNELRMLYKNGRFSETDIIGTTYSSIADGTIVENGSINIQKIEIGGEDGLTLYNVNATVSLNQDAPVLLGNGVLDEFASVEVDNLDKCINFTKK